jgi:TolA-binding protein
MEEYEIEEIKREIVESRSLTIKTNNLVNALAADLKSIAKRQQSYERRIFFNSATAYVVTVVVLFVALKLAWDARLDSVRSETKQTTQKVVELQAELKTAENRDEARQRANRKAGEFYDLIQHDKRREIVQQYDQIKTLPLSAAERAIFADAYDRSKNELSLISYQTGLDDMRTGRYNEAAQAFRESIKLKNDAAHTPEAQYQLAKALRQLGRQREAIPMLMQLSQASADKDVMDEATLLLADSQIDIQAWNDAKSTLRSFIRRFPTSAMINDAKAKLAQLQLYH